ncbi:hypothetical protein GCM10027614_31820 [Micromonospora vulcania]
MHPARWPAQKDLLRRPGTAELRGELARLSALSTGYFLSEEGIEGHRVPRQAPGPMGARGRLTTGRDATPGGGVPASGPVTRRSRRRRPDSSPR